MKTLDLNPLVKWFLAQRRELPWRTLSDTPPSPYAVWVSEVMLQQTQVKTVIPYFEAWMKKFPTLADLAAAEEPEVIKAWEGLGYYSRARRLHEGAKACVKNFQGELPEDPDKLQSLKGIGPYTLGALLSFAFHKRASALDGNVARVMSRLLAHEEEIDRTSTKLFFEKIILEILPQKKPWEGMEALIELGALICQKKPRCLSCPLQSQCRAFLEGKEERLPLKKKGPSILKLNRHALILTTKESVLLKQGEQGKVMEGLWEFPYFEEELPDQVGGYSLKKAEKLPPVTHTFTRYKVELTPYQLEVAQSLEIEGYSWIPLAEIHKLPFSSGHRRLLNLLKRTLVNQLPRLISALLS